MFNYVHTVTNFGKEINCKELNYYGAINGSACYLKTVCYRDKEVFLESLEYPDLIVGNFGMIINKRCLGFKIPHIIGAKGFPSVNITFPKEDGTIGFKQERIERIIMMTFCPTPDPIMMRVLYYDLNIQNTIYHPGYPDHNMDWVDIPTYNRYMESHGKPKRVGKLDQKINELWGDELVHKICQAISNGVKNKQLIEMFNLGDIDTSRYLLNVIRQGYAKKEISTMYFTPKH